MVAFIYGILLATFPNHISYFLVQPLFLIIHLEINETLKVAVQIGERCVSLTIQAVALWGVFSKRPLHGLQIPIDRHFSPLIGSSFHWKAEHNLTHGHNGL